MSEKTQKEMLEYLDKDLAEAKKQAEIERIIRKKKPEMLPKDPKANPSHWVACLTGIRRIVESRPGSVTAKSVFDFAEDAATISNEDNGLLYFLAISGFLKKIGIPVED